MFSTSIKRSPKIILCALLISVATLALTACRNNQVEPTADTSSKTLGESVSPQSTLPSSAPETRALPARSYTYQATTELAQVDESSVQQIYYVDGSYARGDAKPDGSHNAPFTTIMAAHSAVQSALKAGIPTKLVIAPGTYREDIRYLIGNTGKSDTTFRETLLVILIGNSIEALQPAVFMSANLPSGIRAVKVTFPLTAFCGEAVGWL